MRWLSTGWVRRVPEQLRSGYRAGMHRFVRSGVGVVLAVGMVAGCSSDNGGKPATTLPPTGSSTDPGTVVPPPTTTAPATSSPAPTKPVKPNLPATAKHDTAAGAQVAAKYWLDLLTFAMATGNTGPFKAVSSAACTTCDNFAGAINDYVREGYTVSVHKPFRLLATQPLGRPVNRVVSLEFDFVTGQIGVRRHGHTQLGDPSETARTTARLTWRADHWVMTSVALK